MASHTSKQRIRGRQREREALDRVVADTEAGTSQVLVVRGEPGIGKSLLLDYLAERASSSHVVRTAGIESEMDLAFSGLHQLCAPMLDQAQRLPSPQRVALGTVFGTEHGPAPDRFVLGLAVLSLIAEVAEARPLVCIVDDAQWLDDASARTLAFVARRLLAEPVALVFAVREVGAPALADLPERHIGGLARDDALALLDGSVTVPLDDRVRERLVAETRGNPLALLELPRTLSTAELQLGFGARGAMPMAGRIEEGFLRQLQPLPPETRLLLLVAAIEPFGDVPRLWRAADHLSIDPSAAAAAEQTGLVTLRGRVQFRHPLVRSAVFRASPTSDVRAAHRALAVATDPDEDPERHAWHRAFGTVQPDEDVVVELERAARRSMSRGALVNSAAFLQRAAELTADPARRGSRSVSAAAAKVFAGEMDAAAELLATAELCPLDIAHRAMVLRLRASLGRGHGQLAERAQMFHDAATMLEPVNARGARDAYWNALGVQMSIGRLGGGQELQRMAAAARRTPHGSAVRVIDLALDGLSTRLADGYEVGLDLMRRALDACARSEASDPELLQWLWFVPPMAPEVWDDEVWDRITATVVSLVRAAGAMNVLPMAVQFRAEFELHAGESAAARALHAETETLVELMDRPDLRQASLEFAAWQGDDDALQRIGDFVRYMINNGNGRVIGLGEYAKSVLHNGRCRYEDALTAARKASEFPDVGIYGRALVELVEAAARSGADAEARNALRELERRTRVANTDWALGMLARSRALLSHAEDAEAHYVNAIERLGQTRMRAHLARAHLVFGEWLRREQRRVDAREHLRRAHDMLSEMGAAAFAERARRELTATGETVRKRSIDATDALTPQEAQIARLAADGDSNPEIGTRLFISPRTVEYHLGKVFVKLNVKSRRELRNAFR
jgi:DNA-binding CsgD family transcriptional regulator